jgi:indolepyruvate ferredoxin oxidoreductase beta subunit
MTERVTNVVIAGLGGQGVLKASDILAEAAFGAGLEVKKAEVLDGEADYLVVLAPEEVENNLHCLRAGGVLIGPDRIDVDQLSNRRSLNVALLGVLSAYLEISQTDWLAAVRANLPAKLHEANEQAFAMGRTAGQK